MSSIAKNTTELNLRQGPSTHHTILTRLPTGTLLHVLETWGDWLKIIANNQEGFVHGDYVEFANLVRTTASITSHMEPDEGSAVLANLPPQAILSSFKEVDDWVHVIAWGQEGYVKRENLAFPRIGRTTAALNLRQGPGTEHAVIETLPFNTEVYIWDEQGEWLHVADADCDGYVHGDYIGPATQPISDKVDTSAPTPAPTPLDKPSATAPSEAEKIRLPANAGANEKRVATIWNRLGGLLKPLSAQLNINPGIAVAVLTVESGGRAFGSDGRMIIRFENQIFYDYWGRYNPHVYSQHFMYNPDQRWQGHRWRPSASQGWQSCHDNQGVEWAVLEFACTLDDTAAKCSISMGGAQIMGFNHKTAGYASVQEMFKAFAASEHNQIVGFFNFIKGNPNRVKALQTSDFYTFAKLYNGPGQATRYGNLIRNLYDIFQRLR